MDPYPPGRRIFNCLNGHFICGNCKNQLEQQVSTNTDVIWEGLNIWFGRNVRGARSHSLEDHMTLRLIFLAEYILSLKGGFYQNILTASKVSNVIHSNKTSVDQLRRWKIVAHQPAIWFSSPRPPAKHNTQFTADTQLRDRIWVGEETWTGYRNWEQLKG